MKIIFALIFGQLSSALRNTSAMAFSGAFSGAFSAMTISAFALISLVMSADAFAIGGAKQVDLKTTCRTILPMNNVLYKYAASGHLANTDRSRSCSLIYGKGNFSYPRTRSVPFYNCQGKKLGNFRAYQLGGYPFPARYYTPKSQRCASVASKLRANSSCSDKSLWINVGHGKCFKVSKVKGRSGCARPSPCK